MSRICRSCERLRCRCTDGANDPAGHFGDAHPSLALAPEPRTVMALLDAAGIAYEVVPEVEHRCPMCRKRQATAALCPACDDELNAMGRDE